MIYIYALSMLITMLLLYSYLLQCPYDDITIMIHGNNDSMMIMEYVNGKHCIICSHIMKGVYLSHVGEEVI